MEAAVKQMLPCSIVRRKKFLTEIVAIGKSAKWDFSHAETAAEGETRMANIRELNRACSNLVNIVNC